MKEWKIFYGDGSSFGSEDGSPEEAPPWDVQVVAQADDDLGRRFETTQDYYVIDNGRWKAVDFVGMIDHVANVLGIVKVGRMVTNDQFNRAFRMAREDKSLPPKSARRMGEKGER